MTTVKKINVTKSRLSSEIDLFSEAKALSPEAKREAVEEIGEYLKEQILLSVGESKTPIAGASYKPTLSKDYKAFKIAEGLSGVPNLEFSGEMLDQLDYRETSQGIEIGVFGSGALKADGHNNFSGASDLPLRQFLPNVGQRFKRDIEAEIDRIIKDKSTEQLDVTRSDVAEISSKEETSQFLKELMPDFNRAERIDAVLRNPYLRNLFDEFNLLRFLSDGEG